MNGSCWWITPGGDEYYESAIRGASVTASRIEFKVLNHGITYFICLDDKGNGWWSGTYTSSPGGAPVPIGGRMFVSSDNSMMLKGNWKEVNQYTWIVHLS